MFESIKKLFSTDKQENATQLTSGNLGEPYNKNEQILSDINSLLKNMTAKESLNLQDEAIRARWIAALRKEGRGF